MRLKKWIVISNKMDKTVVVSVDTYKNNPKYKKRFKVTKKFYAHNEDNNIELWQVVTIKETRPLSKTKRWEVVKID